MQLNEVFFVQYRFYSNAHRDLLIAGIDAQAMHVLIKYLIFVTLRCFIGKRSNQSHHSVTWLIHTIYDCVWFRMCSSCIRPLILYVFK